MPIPRNITSADKSLIWLFIPLLTVVLAFGIRMLEWPSWENPEFRFNNEMLLATHDAYHWLSGAVGYGRATDHPMALVLRYIADVSGLAPAQIAFWLPPVLAAFTAGLVCVLGGAAGSLPAGMACGLIASIAPGFLGRTLLGYYDTDLITLLFPILILLPLLFWSQDKIFNNILGTALVKPLAPTIKKHFKLSQKKTGNNFRIRTFSIIWPFIFSLSGLLAFFGVAWHSLFPYLTRFNTFLLITIILLFSLPGRKRLNFILALCWILPALAGLYGFIFPLLIIFIRLAHKSRNNKLFTFAKILKKILYSKGTIFLLSILIIWLFLKGDIFNILLAHINAYLKNSGDTLVSNNMEITFPSVAQSIIEVQDLSFVALFSYFHPWLEAAFFGLAGFIFIIIKKPAFLFLCPFAMLALASAKLGGRMVMFGAPVVALGLSIPLYWILRIFFAKLNYKACGWITCVISCAVFVLPFLDMIPAMSQGPSINRRQAAALYAAQDLTPEDGKLWIWWDWGYAAHYFARRATIADGAEHGGPSLYLPAAVFASDNPRFGRQLIKLTAQKGGHPGNFFTGLDAIAAQLLINRLHSNQYPLVNGKGRQFIIVSFEMLRLGFWISNFGNWNFISCQGKGGALSIVPQALEYRLSSGEIKLEDSGRIILPSSIAIFEETGLIQRNYVQEWFAAHPEATRLQQQHELERRRNVNFLFNKITNEKLAMDESIYMSLMVQLLLCDPADTKIAPYFRLIYDNVFTRIFEVIPN